MAKSTMSEHYANATIDLEQMTITELTKDSERSYSLRALLERWDGVEGISLRLSTERQLPEWGVEEA